MLSNQINFIGESSSANVSGVTSHSVDTESEPSLANARSSSEINNVILGQVLKRKRKNSLKLMNALQRSEENWKMCSLNVNSM